MTRQEAEGSYAEGKSFLGNFTFRYIVRFFCTVLLKLHWQGSTIRLIKLEQYLQSYNLHPAISSSDTLPQIDTANVLIIRDNNQQVAVQIDHFWGEIEVSLHQVEANTTLPTGISNYTILDNEQIVPVLSSRP